MSQMGVYTKEDANALLTTHAAALDAHTKHPFELWRVGSYFLGQAVRIWTISTLSANRLEGIPFIVPRAMSFDQIVIKVTTAVPDTEARLGIYADGINLYPGSLVRDCGTVSTATIGIKPIPLDPILSLAKGLYFKSCNANGGPVLTGLYVTYCPLGEPRAEFDAEGQVWYATSAYGTLPNPFTAGGAIGWFCSAIALRIASLD